METQRNLGKIQAVYATMLFAFIVLLLETFFQGNVLAASSDDEPLGKGLYICSMVLTYTDNHNFGYGKGAERCYGAKAEWYVCKEDNKFVYQDRDAGKVCWFPSSNKLDIEFKELGTSTYRCSHQDPVLSDRPPSCSFQSYKKGSRGAVIMDQQVRAYIQKKVVSDFKNTVSPGARKVMKIEAFEHSMEVSVQPKNITSPPGNVRVVLKYASDISPIGQKWPVVFTLKKQNVGSLKPVTLRLANSGTASYTFKGLSPGTYWALASLSDSLSDYVAESLLFTITAKGGTGHREWKLIQPKSHGTYLGGTIPIKLQLPQNVPLKNAELVLRWSWIKENIYYSIPLKTKLFLEETIPISAQVAATRIFQRNESTARLLHLKNRFSMGEKGPCVYFLDVYLKGANSKWNYHSQAMFLKIDRLIRGSTDRKKFGPNRQNLVLRNIPLIKITSPRKGQTYTNSVPVNLQFFSKSKKPNQLTLVWSWRKEPAGKPSEFFRQNYTIPAGKTNFSKSFSVSSLVKKKNQKLNSSDLNGSIWLETILKQGSTTIQKAHANFYVAQLGTPARRNESRKKSLATKMHLPAISMTSIRPSYHIRENISIGVKNTGGGAPQIQVQFRPNAKRPFQALGNVSHRFMANGNGGTLILSFQNPGEYRLRLKGNNTWGPWRTFKVVNPRPAAAKNVISIPLSGISSSRLATHPAPTILQPLQGQSFIMSGNTMTVKIKVRHAKNQKVVLQVQHQTGEVSPASFKNINPPITPRYGTNQSSFDIRFTSTGAYRVRAKLASPGSSNWSPWRSFRLNRLAKITPSLRPSQTKPANKSIHIKPNIIRPNTSGFSIK